MVWKFQWTKSVPKDLLSNKDSNKVQIQLGFSHWINIYIFFFLKGKKVALHGNKSCKLRALKDGLLLALDLEIPNLEIEMDSFIAVKSLNSTTIPNAFLSSIVDDCRYLPERFEATTSNIFIGKQTIVLKFLLKLIVSSMLILLFIQVVLRTC